MEKEIQKLIEDFENATQDLNIKKETVETSKEVFKIFKKNGFTKHSDEYNRLNKVFHNCGFIRFNNNDVLIVNNYKEVENKEDDQENTVEEDISLLLTIKDEEKVSNIKFFKTIKKLKELLPQ